MGLSLEVVSLRMHRFVFGSFVLVALAAFAADGGGNTTRGVEVRENVIVPCLLPARVRKLGGIVYPERRKLTQTTAKSCELRGGEYTAYDRARPESAVAFFTPLADQGDPTAQTSLGEVYEYLFEPPRFQDAATWYQKAMDQGDLTAVRRLAHLYELGLGVEKDPLLATNLWRRALGTNDDFVLASTLEKAQSAADQRVSELTAALRARNAEADALAQLVSRRPDDTLEPESVTEIGGSKHRPLAARSGDRPRIQQRRRRRTRGPTGKGSGRQPAQARRSALSGSVAGDRARLPEGAVGSKSPASRPRERPAEARTREDDRAERR